MIEMLQQEYKNNKGEMTDGQVVRKITVLLSFPCLWVYCYTNNKLSYAQNLKNPILFKDNFSIVAPGTSHYNILIACPKYCNFQNKILCLMSTYH